eukprot:Nk52_evm53s207 gene=Nk52_evmTU53s207
MGRLGISQKRVPEGSFFNTSRVNLGSRSMSGGYLSLFVLILFILNSISLVVGYSLTAAAATRSTSPFHHLIRRNDTPCPPCPPCEFQCDNEDHICMYGGVCDGGSKQCKCSDTFAGQNCSVPVCQNSPSTSPGALNRCDCEDGWGGTFCNICQNDDICHFGANKYCDKSFQAVLEKRFYCQVTSDSVLDLVNNATVSARLPVGTDTEKQKGEFQLWVEDDTKGRQGLFSCAFNCSQTIVDSNARYVCNDIHCSADCVPGEGDCTEILLSVLDSIEGEMSYTCDEKTKICSVDQEQLADLLGVIDMKCDAGECSPNAPPVDPGSDPTPTPFPKLVVGGATAVALSIILAVLIGKHRYGRRQFLLYQKFNEEEYFASQRQSMTLVFNKIGYVLGGKTILQNVSGVAYPGKLLAIMGGSGAGKSTCLDILSGKTKRGRIDGEITVNGKPFTKAFKRRIGFVDQEEALMATLTVQESLTYSAMLRLPDKIPNKIKKRRVREIMRDLKISHIAHSRIGNSTMRGISGGEKRRVSIAMELVTDPCILYCDEPTSGLDSYNAYIVMDCLSRLASKSNTTIICSIHQPRSNIYKLFDNLMLLTNGELAYYGACSEAVNYFREIGYNCPPEFNPADFLIDITVSSGSGIGPSQSEGDADDVELLRISDEGEQNTPETELEDSNRLHILTSSYMESDIAAKMNDEIASLCSYTEQASDISANQKREKYSKYSASFWTQLLVLSERSFLNLYRNPSLMMGHYVTSLCIGTILGLFYYQLDFNDIGAIQNRMGALLIMCAFLAFGSLSSVELFISERALYVHERANGFYFPSTFFLAKMLFDVVPLRVVPPLIMGTVSYAMIGLRPTLSHFTFFLATLVLVNLVATSICLLLGIMMKKGSLASLLASLIMLLSLMLTGIFNNKDSMPPYVAWLRYLSFFNYGYEALCVNELNGMMISGSIVGSKYTVNARVILVKLGFDPDDQNFNVAVLLFFFVVCQVMAYGFLKTFVKQKR